MYDYSPGPVYRIYPGKIHTQELHHWIYNPDFQAKWEYNKDLNNGQWWQFYTPFHKSPPASEKIVNWTRHWSDASYTDQVWAYIMKYNRK